MNFSNYLPNRITEKLFAVFIVMFISEIGFSQKKISYTVTEETYYEIAANAKVSNIISQDLIEMKPSKAIYKISRIKEGNNIEETKEFLTSYKTESWLPDLKKIVTNNTGTKIYDTKGKLIFERNHPAHANFEFNAENNMLEYFEFPTYEQLNSNEETKKAELKEKENGKIEIKRRIDREVEGRYADFGDTEEIELDIKSAIMKKSVKNDRNHEIESEHIYFRKTQDKTAKNLKIFERYSKENPKYEDVFKVKYIKYDNYEIDDKKVFNNEKGRQSLEEYQNDGDNNLSLKVMPNPSENEVNISLPENFEIKELAIYNEFGAKTPVIIKVQNSKLIKIDISNYNTGIYILSLQHSKGNISQKFIKN